MYVLVCSREYMVFIARLSKSGAPYLAANGTGTSEISPRRNKAVEPNEADKNGIRKPRLWIGSCFLLFTLPLWFHRGRAIQRPQAQWR